MDEPERNIEMGTVPEQPLPGIPNAETGRRVKDDLERMIRNNHRNMATHVILNADLNEYPVHIVALVTHQDRTVKIYNVMIRVENERGQIAVPGQIPRADLNLLSKNKAVPVIALVSAGHISYQNAITERNILTF